MRSVLVLAAAAAFGLTMRLVAGLADDSRMGDVLLDVVNWAALWVVVPVLAGRWSRALATAALLGMGAGVTEVAVYYAGDLAGSPFKVFWVSGAAVACGAFGALSHRIRPHRWSHLFIPCLFILEPPLILLVFHVLGRSTWSSWTTSAASEVVFGVVAMVVCHQLARRAALRPTRWKTRLSWR